MADRGERDPEALDRNELTIDGREKNRARGSARVFFSSKDMKKI
jgi:hypothetical protein